MNGSTDGARELRVDSKFHDADQWVTVSLCKHAIMTHLLAIVPRSPPRSCSRSISGLVSNTRRTASIMAWKTRTNSQRDAVWVFMAWSRGGGSCASSQHRARTSSNAGSGSSAKSSSTTTDRTAVMIASWSWPTSPAMLFTMYPRWVR